MSLEIVKNTLPYIQPYSIVNNQTGETLGHYKTEKIAEEALQCFNNTVNLKNKVAKKIDKKNPVQCWKDRVNKPKGDQPLKPNKRRIVLDD